MSDGSEIEQARKYFEEAYRHQLKGELEEAAALYKKSIETFPTAEARTFWAGPTASTDALDEAISECRRAIEIDPDFGNPYNDIGAYLIEQGLLDEAVPWLEKPRARRATRATASRTTTWAESTSANASGLKPSISTSGRSSTIHNTNWHKPRCTDFGLC